MSAGADEVDAGPLLLRIGWEFRDPQLLRTALTHSSRSHEEGGGPGNERLEFLGDAVLDLVVTEFLFEAHPEWREGELTRARASLVNREALAARAREIELGRYARLGRTEIRDRGAGKETILADLFEALVGALYLDGGLETARRFLVGVYAEALREGRDAPARDPKTRFQEWAHSAHRTTPSYRVISDSGIENDAERFRVEVRLKERPWGEGRARSKRAAERMAAAAALRRACVDG